ncbi:CoA ester lyase [Bacillus sp. ISL-47]|uniref:HpcH/HpaI aldolase/citrate lyase family protein n=1 Tax=Bacillus sp. ISL-47 TaxID=2819130 RepID=UPI001BE8A750|nr:CoA ester lyase [Bacillus sp. ISL-47]MBT2689249.1 CoA ester lyase [Bacillus sp. ISL-47]MBT2708626.1 CoA ester lyase [Pseudomonas sp. ISL-84]
MIDTKKSSFLRRSTLIMPANKQKFIEKALDRGADAIQLDLEDGVAPQEKQEARQYLKESIGFLNTGNVEVLVRINDGLEMSQLDLEAAILPGLNGIVIPKVEDALTVQRLEDIVQELEVKRNITSGSIHFTILIETAKGFMNIKEITRASSRIVAMNLGTEDFTLDLGIEPSDAGDELLVPKMQAMIAAKAAGIQPLGIVGSMAGFNDLENLYKVARKSYQLGHVGASCIHPAQVAVMNKAFSPTSEQIDYAKRVADIFEKAKSQGDGAVALNGKMIDIPVAKRAYSILEKAERIRIKEQKLNLT